MAPGWLLLSFGWDQDSARLPTWPTSGCVAKMVVVGSVEAKMSTRLPRWLLLVASIRGKMANYGAISWAEDGCHGSEVITGGCTSRGQDGCRSGQGWKMAAVG